MHSFRQTNRLACPPTSYRCLPNKLLAVSHALPTAKRLLETLVVASGILFLCGCEDEQPAKPGTSAQQPAGGASSPGPTMMPGKGTTAWGPVLEDTSPPAAASTPSATPPAKTTPPAQQPSTATPAAPPAVTPSVPPTIQKKAEVGVGKKGRGYGKGVIVTPIASLFATRERLVFDVTIPEAMKLFKAMEDRAPKSHEEFMEKIIKANNIHLPELPEGDRYMYDPKTEQLMVESPAPE
jgi:hypothetical protein